MTNLEQPYRVLNCGEIIQLGDEVQADDGSWDLAIRCVGTPAPDPAYTSHRVYRRPNGLRRTAALKGREELGMKPHPGLRGR